MKHPVEFCGGTHVQRTGEIGAFVLTTEESVAKGIRRVVGITGDKARQAMEVGKALRAQAAVIRSGPAEQIADGLADLQKKLADCEIPLLDRMDLRCEIAELQKRVKQQSKQEAAQAAGALRDVRKQLLEEAEKVGETAILVGVLPEAPVAQMRETADWLRAQAGSAAVCLATAGDGKAMLVAAMTPDMVKKGLRAGDLIKQVAPAVDGRGGGRPDFAQAGGKNPAGIDQAIKDAADWIKSHLSG
jgi:alanyl-tRNA synthetase